MAFCNNCGAQLEEGATVCYNCGVQTKVSSAPAANNTTNTGSSNFASKILGTNDSTSSFDPADIEANKVLALFSYLGILVLIPLLAGSNSAYAKYHANQGIILLIVSIALSIVCGVVGFIFGFVAGFIGLGLLATLAAFGFGSVVSIVIFALAVIGIINAVQGKAKELPLIGKFRILK